MELIQPRGLWGLVPSVLTIAIPLQLDHLMRACASVRLDIREILLLKARQSLILQCPVEYLGLGHALFRTHPEMRQTRRRATMVISTPTGLTLQRNSIHGGELILGSFKLFKALKSGTDLISVLLARPTVVLVVLISAVVVVLDFRGLRCGWAIIHPITPPTPCVSLIIAACCLLQNLMVSCYHSRAKINYLGAIYLWNYQNIRTYHLEKSLYYLVLPQGVERVLKITTALATSPITPLRARIPSTRLQDRLLFRSVAVQ